MYVHVQVLSIYRIETKALAFDDGTA